MDKSALIQAVLEVLGADLESALREAREAASAATDPDARAENKYDTRALESSYLARGQAQRVVELQDAISAFRALPETSVNPGGVIVSGCLVVLETSSGPLHYFTGPAAGGTEVRHGGCEIVLITPASPLGRRLMGLREGDVVTLRQGADSWRVLSVR